MVNQAMTGFHPVERTELALQIFSTRGMSQEARNAKWRTVLKHKCGLARGRQIAAVSFSRMKVRLWASVSPRYTVFLSFFFSYSFLCPLFVNIQLFCKIRIRKACTAALAFFRAVLLNTSKYFNWTKRVTSQCHLNVPSLTLSPLHCLGEPTWLQRRMRCRLHWLRC